MAKRKRRVLRARKEQRDDDSLLVRSAESLGRVIGSLQRQVRGSAKRARSMADDTMGALPDLPRFDNLFGNATRASKRPRKAAAARKTSKSRARLASRKVSKKR